MAEGAALGAKLPHGGHGQVVAANLHGGRDGRQRGLQGRYTGRQGNQIVPLEGDPGFVRLDGRGGVCQFGIDLGVIPENRRPVVDRLFFEAQPGHIQYAGRGAFESAQRDLLRARLLREEFAKFAPPDFTEGGKN